MGNFKKRPNGEIQNPTPDIEPPFFNPKSNGKRRSPEDKAIINQRIEQCRALLRLSMSRGDIKRTLARAWGIKPRSVEKYVSVARKRNRNFLASSEDELLADSLAWWIGKKQDGERTAKKARDRADYAEDEISAADETLHDGVMTSKEIMREANKRKAIATKILEDSRRLLLGIEDRLITYQTRIDDLTGIRPAPRIAALQPGNDVATQPAPVSEPLNIEDSRRRLTQMYNDILRRNADRKAASGVLAIANTSEGDTT